MRVVAEIPHHTFRITVFNYNSKYLIKIEWGQLEQTFKVGEGDLMNGTDDVNKMLTDDFLRNCMLRFRAMQDDFLTAFQNISQ
jgi:hypothetical protein